MVPSDFLEETTCEPSCGRPKRGAAVRAEGVFKALALTGVVPEETSGIELTTFVNDKAGVSAAEANTAEFETTASEVTAAAAVTSPEVLESPLHQSVRHCEMRPHFSVGEDSVGAKQAATCSSRRAKVKKPSKLGLTTIDEKKSRVGNQNEQKRAEVDATTPAMRRGAGARLASGRLESQSKTEGQASSAAIDRVLQNLSSLRTGRMRTPPNPAGMEDVWKVVEDVLQNLPNTSELTVDDLVGHSTLRRFRPSDKAGSCGCGDNSCEEKERCPWVVALKVMPGSGASARDGEKLEMTEELTNGRAGMERALEKQGLREEKEVGARVKHHAVQGNGEEPDSSDESAKLRTLPRQEMVDDTLEEVDLELENVEMKLTNTFQKLATKIEGLRSDPNSPEETKRREWMEKTLKDYEPLRRQKEENERRERKRKDEEQEAVCYVCGSGYHSHNDTIVFCERCCVAVHASCYNAEGVHLVDKWYCDFCQFGISKAKKNLEVAVLNAEAVAAAAAAASAEPDDAMQIDDEIRTPLATEDDEADLRATDHVEQAVKKNKTSSESPPGVEWLPGAAGDAAVMARAIESLAIPAVPEFDPKAEVTTMEIQMRFGRYVDKDEDVGRREASSTAKNALRPLADGLNPFCSLGSKAVVNSLGGVTEAKEVDLGKCHEDRQKGGGMFDRNGSLVNGHVSTDGRNVRQFESRSWMPWGSNEAVDAAKTSTEADVSMLNAQHATKRSWEDFCGKAKAGNAAAGAVKAGARNSSYINATVCAPSAGPPSTSSSEGSVTAVATATSFRSELSSCSSATVTSSEVGGSGSSSASVGVASAGKVDAGSGRSTIGNDSKDVATATQGLLERAAALAGLVPEVAGALAALEEAEAVVGIDLPPKDKGPPDPDAVCMLCPVPRGALLKAEKGNGGVAWCHCLCALSKELLIEDRVVKLKGRIKGNSGTCSKCKKGPSGGLISCSKDGCNAMFHPTCGQRSGGSAMRGPHLHPSAWKARCRKHAEPRPTENPGYIPATSRMPIKDMYKSSSTRTVAKTTAKTAPVDLSNLSFSGGSGSDDVIAGYKAEARVVALKSSGDLCPPGYCHRCRRKRKWTVGCALCDQFYCAFCIANLRESPFAVLEMAKAMFDAKALGLPMPDKHFTCYSCRGTCGCAGCKKAMPTDKTAKDAKDLKTKVKYSPAHSSTSTTDHLSTSTSSSTSPPRNESPVQVSRSDVPKLKAAAAAIMSDSPGWMGASSAVSAMEIVETPEPAAPAVAASHSPAMHASVSSSAALENVPKKVADNHRAAQEKHLLTPNAVDPSLHGNQYIGVESARPHANANTRPLDTTATRATPPGHSPPTEVLSDVETSILKWYEAVENSPENNMAGAARSSMKPSGGATSAPTQLHKQVGGGNPVGRERPGVRVSPKMRPSSAGQPSSFSSSAMANYDGPRNSSAIAPVSSPWSLPAIASSQASSNAVGRPKTGIVFRDVEYTVAATNPTTSATMPTANGARPAESNTVANRAQTHQRSKSNVQRMQPQTKVQTLAPLRPFTQARAHARAQGNANAHPYYFAHSNHVHAQHPVGGMMSTGVQYSSAALASVGAPRSLIVLAEKAEALRRKARNALETAKHLSQAVVDAKAFSDQNNKAAMLRVDAATKLKDKLIMANELINGYHQIRRDAEREARHAVKEKLTSISRLREAEEDARAKNPAANADDALTNAWWLSGESPALQLPAVDGALALSNGGDGCLPESIARDGSSSPFRPPTGVLTNMKLSQGSRVAISVIEALRLQVRSASATAREKEATLDELVKRQNKAEDGRTELVHATQRASEAASEASQSAMHYEQEMRCKQAEEQAAFGLASTIDKDARTAEWEVQMMVNNLGVGRAGGGFGGNGMAMANGGGGGGHVFHGVGNAATGGAASSGLFGCGGAVNNGGDGISGGGGGSGGSHTGGQGGGFTWSQYQRPGQNLDSGRRHPSNP